MNQREVVDNVITALTSNQMIAPSYWVDPRSGNDYMLTVQYPENRIRDLLDLRNIPLHADAIKEPTMLDAVTQVTPLSRRPKSTTTRFSASSTSTSIRPARISARSPAASAACSPARQLPAGVRIALRGMVQGMDASFRSFGFGLILALVLLYLILVAQFRSFIDPLLILLAVPTGLTGVLVAL